MNCRSRSEPAFVSLFADGLVSQWAGIVYLGPDDSEADAREFLEEKRAEYLQKERS